MAMENTSEVSDILSERCRQRFLNKPQPEIDRASDCERRPYDRETNPKGFIRLSLSENHLCDDIIKEKLEDPKHHVIESWMLQYCDNRGTLKLRQAVADYLTMKTKSSKPVSAKHISILNGAESVITTLTYIICDPGDGFLIPAPCYGGINVGLTADMTRVGEVKPVYAYLQSQVNFDAGEKRPFQLTVDRLETALRKARDEGINVRGLFLINPHNPLGDIYPAEVIMDCLHFAHRNSLHVVIDEIYMGTIFKPDNSFTSVLNLDDIPDPQRTHLIWGFSKDFGLAGFRCGVLHSKNSKLHEAVDYLAYFNVVSSHTQNLLAEFISDHEWINNVFFPTNHQRLRESHQCISDGLTKLGIPHLHRSAGLFVWADFRLYLPQPSFEEELSLERRFEKAGVGISAGSRFDCGEPGWFRIVFAHPINVIETALERMGNVIEEIKKEICGDEFEAFKGLDGLCSGGFENVVAGSAAGLGSLIEGAVPGKDSDNLDDLVTLFQNQVKTSDWLRENTAEKWIQENEELFAEYQAAAKK